MAFTDIYDAATADPSTLKKQIAVALVMAAQDIVNEDDQAENHARRLNLANDIRKPGGPQKWSEVFAWRVLENLTIQASPAAATDGDVEFVVNSLIDSFAF